MRLYDTAARAVSDLVPRGDVVSLYVCGITPYDGGHLGHAMTYHTFDVVTRRLQSLGHEVRSVRNVTDVDDDIMRVSRERGVRWDDLAESVTRAFDKDMEAIDVLPVFATPRASEHVLAMIDWIRDLVDRGYAYAVDGWVYFEVSRLETFGNLCRLDERAMVQLLRERGGNPEDPRKRGPLDFVLWQPSLEDEPSWPSPWSDGRPGWHIECSVLATAFLGAPIDLHGGGDDLIYPHHESEIAQAAGAGIHPYVSRWAHVAMVGYQGQKMSKSLGNLVFVRDLLAEVPPATIRLLLAAQRYRTAWEYTPELLATAERRRQRLESAARSGGRLGAERATHLLEEFLAAIDEDLDTPEALRVADATAVAIEEAAARGGGPADGRAGGDVLAEMLGIIGAAGAVDDVLPTPLPAADA
jgi:L-cysteine:1D-myo-inositol 2-amino-2-deoxy-alpha-D-glucopyranoside ligase